MENGTRVLVVGGSPQPSSSLLLERLTCDADVVVAVDRGLDALLAAGCVCDLFVGDLDSVSLDGASCVRAREEGSDAPVREVARFDPHKDDTDLGLALRIIRRRLPDAQITCTCATGGRPDHALAVLGCLTAAELPRIDIIEDGMRAAVLRGPATLELPLSIGKTFSFVPLSQEAEVSETGMRWNLDHEHVPLLSDLGISNVIETQESAFTCHEGVAVAWLFG